MSVPVQPARRLAALRTRRKEGGEEVAKEGAEGGYGVAEQGGERVGAEVGKGELEEGEELGLGLGAEQPGMDGAADFRGDGEGIEPGQLGAHGLERQVERVVEQGAGEVFVLGQAGGVGQDGGEPLGEVIDGRVGKLAGFGAKLTL